MNHLYNYPVTTNVREFIDKINLNSDYMRDNNKIYINSLLRICHIYHMQ